MTVEKINLFELIYYVTDIEVGANAESLDVDLILLYQFCYKLNLSLKSDIEYPQLLINTVFIMLESSSGI